MSKYYKPTILIALFIISCLTTYFGWFNFVPVITHTGRMLLTYLPTYFTCAIPLITLIMTWMYFHTLNIKNRYRIERVYAFIVLILMSFSIILHVIMIITQTGWSTVYGIISPLFPYDQLALMVIYLAFGILVCVHLHKHKEDYLVPVTINNPMRKRAFVAVAFALPFTCYLTPAFYQIFRLFEGYDPNWYGVVPALLTFLLPILSLIMFIIYKHSGSNKKAYFNGLVTVYTSTIGLLVWIIIAIIINPYIFAQSLTSYYLLGYAAKIPGALLLIIIMEIVYLTVATTRYIKRYRVKENKTVSK